PAAASSWPWWPRRRLPPCPRRTARPQPPVRRPPPWSGVPPAGEDHCGLPRSWLPNEASPHDHTSGSQLSRLLLLTTRGHTPRVAPLRPPPLPPPPSPA